MQPSSRPTNSPIAPAKQEIALSDLWLILRKRRWLILGVSLGLGLLAGIHGERHGKRYTATGQIQITPGANSGLKQISSVLGAGDLDETMESDIIILTSNKLLAKVVSTLSLQDDPLFVGAGEVVPEGVDSPRTVPLYHGDMNNPYVRTALIGRLRGMLTISRVPHSEMVSISCQSSSPAQAATIVNALESEYIKNNFTEHYNNTQQVSKWLDGQIDDLRGAVQSSQDQMVDLQKKLGILALDPNHNTMVSEITNLEKQVADATQQRVAVEARYRILQSLPADQVLDMPTPLGNEGTGLLGSLRAQLATDNAELAKLEPVYGPNYPQVKQLEAHKKALKEEMAKQQGRIIAQAKDATAIAQATQNQAQAMLDSRMHDIFGQRDDEVKYQLLSQEYESNRKMYESILARLREAAVDAGLDSADISIVDLALLPTAPSSMPVRSQVVLGLLAGLMISVIGAFLLEQLDTRMRDSKHIQELLGLPALAVVPQTSWKGKEAIREQGVGPEMLWDARSSFAEAIRVFRTSIQLSSVARQSRVIAVTSCQPGEGKSTVSTNLAAALAQGGKKVILVDTDMRRPSVYWRLGLSAKKGLSEFLTGNETLESVIQTHQVLSTLDMIPSGFSPPLPADLLSSEEMKNLVATLRSRYDYVIFDTPPALSVTDPLIVSSQADGLVLVIRQGFCTRAMLSRVAEIFRDVDVKVYGFVLNGVDASLPEYYGYLGYYSYDYKN